MNKLAHLSIVTAVAVVGYGGARADDEVQQKTRAEVVFELTGARAGGALAAMHGEDSGSAWLSEHGAYGAVASSGFKARVVAARNAEDIDVTGEDSGSFALARTASRRASPQVPVLASGPDMPAHWARYAGPGIDRHRPEPATNGHG